MPIPASILRPVTNSLPMSRGFARIAATLQRKLGLRGVEQWLELPAPGLGKVAINPARPILLAPYLFTRPMTKSYLRSPLALFMREKLTASGGGVFVDVGANLGFYTLLARHLAPKGIVLAFEPEPTIFESLCRTIKLNALDHVRCHQLALSDQPGSTQLVIHQENYGGHSIASTPGKGKVTTEVKTDTLTTVIDREEDLEANRIELIKIDVEGAETAVIRGLMEFLDRGHRPAIFCEVRGPEVKRSGGSAREVAGLLEPLGYGCFQLTTNGTPKTADATEVRQIADLLFLAESSTPT